ncbi:MAG: hypothetical protein ACRDTA_02725 [Pseudonocardiaceae bacterium]
MLRLLVPALVRTFDQDGDAFLVEEVVDGGGLRRWVAEHATGRLGVLLALHCRWPPSWSS